MEEFEESLPRCRSNSSTRAANCSHWELKSSTRAVSWAIVASFATSRSFSSSFDGSVPDSTDGSLLISGRLDPTVHHLC
ncbi:hypothetical protein [Streptomyces sp. NPDC051162]|uniref:hypothetical protein n=1 Tax=Streptomyces sp. NPDC051162 TaxID=3154747 RepID=UPI0034434F5B